MRIISGKFKGRKFFPPADNWPTRPTTDFSKEGLFNILNNWLDFSEVRFLDLFGGTGNHSYEFISRGCKDVTYVDKFTGCIKFVSKTSKLLEIEDLIQIHKVDVFKFIATTHRKYDYIFAGPPYGLPTIDKIPDLIFHYDILAKDGLFVMEHNPNHNYELHPNFVEVRTYGKTHFAFFENLPVDEQETKA